MSVSLVFKSSGRLYSVCERENGVPIWWLSARVVGLSTCTYFIHRFDWIVCLLLSPFLIFLRLFPLSPCWLSSVVSFCPSSYYWLLVLPYHCYPAKVKYKIQKPSVPCSLDCRPNQFPKKKKKNTVILNMLTLALSLQCLLTFTLDKWQGDIAPLNGVRIPIL